MRSMRVSLLLMSVFFAFPALAADVVIVNPNSSDPYRSDYRRAYRERYNMMFPNDQYRHNPYDAPFADPRRAMQEESRRDYEQKKQELMQQYAPPSTPALTRADIEEILDEKLSKKHKEAEKPAEPEEDGFGKIGGIGSVGGIGNVGANTDDEEEKTKEEEK